MVTSESVFCQPPAFVVTQPLRRQRGAADAHPFWHRRCLLAACSSRAAPAFLCCCALAHGFLIFALEMHQKRMAVSESSRQPPPRVNGVTLVTAYWNVGEFPETPTSIHRHPGLYRQWLSTFEDILNPMVAFFDDEEIALLFEKHRAGLPTKIIIVEKENLWSFRLRRRVQEVLDQPDYPKNIPTNFADYNCANHAKYDAVEIAIRDDYFHTTHIAWIDVGMFRDVYGGTDRRRFAIETPSDHLPNLVAYTQINAFDSSATVKSILMNGWVWVAGGFFLGTVDVVGSLCSEYKKFTEMFLERNLTLADQSILYAMFATDNTERPKVGIQAFLPDSRYNPWFSLCFVMRERWLTKSLPIPHLIFTGNASAASPITNS